MQCDKCIHEKVCSEKYFYRYINGKKDEIMKNELTTRGEVFQVEINCKYFKPLAYSGISSIISGLTTDELGLLREHVYEYAEHHRKSPVDAILDPECFSLFELFIKK